MNHFGILCPATKGHLNPSCALGRELARRGHRVTVFAMGDAERVVRAAGLGFRAIGSELFPPGELGRCLGELGQLRGLAAVRYTIQLFARSAEMVLRDGPAAVRAEGVDALIVDQVSAGGGSVAEHLGLPFVNIGNALLINEEEHVPPITTGWRYDPSPLGRLRNRLGYAALERMTRPIFAQTERYRAAWGLPSLRDREAGFSTLAQVAQQPPGFDFPRRRCPPTLHYAGPFLDSSGREPVPFPFERLDGRPLIYASMGTLQNRVAATFRTIAAACAGLDAQLVLSLGGSAEPSALPDLPGDPVVVSYAPQLELLERVSLAITHAGLNTALESLSRGVPMVAIPVTNDQPAVAARLAWLGVAEVVPLARLNVRRLRAAIGRVLGDPSYRDRAERFRECLSKLNGAARAADIIEHAVGSG